MFGRKKCKCGCADKDCKTTDAFVKVLGGGCKNCNELEKNTVEALEALGLESKVAHVTSMEDIAAYGVTRPPALVFGETVVSSGKVLTKDQVIEIIEANRSMFP